MLAVDPELLIRYSEKQRAVKKAEEEAEAVYMEILASLRGEEWIDTAEAVRRSGLTARMLQYKAANGEIRALRNGKRWRYNTTDLASYTASHDSRKSKQKGAV